MARSHRDAKRLDGLPQSARRTPQPLRDVSLEIAKINSDTAIEVANINSQTAITVAEINRDGVSNAAQKAHDGTTRAATLTRSGAISAARIGAAAIVAVVCISIIGDSYKSGNESPAPRYSSEGYSPELEDPANMPGQVAGGILTDGERKGLQYFEPKIRAEYLLNKRIEDKGEELPR